MRERNRLDRALGDFDQAERELADNRELVELAEADDDAESLFGGTSQPVSDLRPARVRVPCSVFRFPSRASAM